MANIKQAKKRVRQTEKRRKHNGSLRSKLKTYIKKILNNLVNNLEIAKNSYPETVSVIDKMVHKKIIHKKKGARCKSRLLAKIRKYEKEISKEEGSKEELLQEKQESSS